MDIWQRINGVVGVLAVGAVGCTDETPKHWSAFETCVIGKPLTEGENIFARVRGVQLAESMKSVGGEADWPNRCTVHAEALFETLSESGKPGMMRRAMQEQLGCGGKEGCTFPTDGHPLPAADKLWEAAADVARVAADGVAAPAEPVTSLTLAEWPALAEGKVHTETWSDSGELILTTDARQGGGTVCALGGAKAKCSRVEGLPKFSKQAPLRFALDSKQPILVGGVFSEDQGVRSAGYSLQAKQAVSVFGDIASAAYDGFGFLQKPPPADADPLAPAPPPEMKIGRVSEGKVGAAASLKLTARVRGPVVVHDWLAYVERDKDQKPLFGARRLNPTGGLFGESVTYPGQFAGAFNVCKTKGGAAIGSFSDPVRQLGAKASGSVPLTSIVLKDGSWSKPVEGEIPKQVGQFSGWTCGDGWGAFSWLEQQDTRLLVTELRCTATECKRSKVEWTQPDVRNVLALGNIGDRMIVVYQAASRDTRLRIAPLSDLPKAKSVLGFESDAFGGLTSMTPRIVSQGDAAYLIVEVEGTRALQISQAGEVSVVKP